MNAHDYCQQKAVKSGSSFYYSFLFLSASQRQAMTALYAFCREIDDIVDDCAVNVAEVKLAWWTEELDRIFLGKPEHPVGIALQQPIEQFNLNKVFFVELLKGMAMDLNGETYLTFADLKQYCYRVASTVGLLAIEIFGYQHPETKIYAENLGYALQLTNILRDVHEDLHLGRLYIPEEDLARFQVKEADLNSPKAKAEVIELFRFQAQRANDYYRLAYDALPDSDRYQQRCGLIMSQIYHTLLEEIIADEYRVLEHRVSLTPIRKLWIAWSTARQEKKRLISRQRV